VANTPLPAVLCLLALLVQKYKYRHT
jgi:hypothetical protein